MATGAGETILDVANLKKRFGDLRVLDDISLEVTSGEVAVVIGPSASGKSALSAASTVSRSRTAATSTSRARRSPAVPRSCSSFAATSAERLATGVERLVEPVEARARAA